ncbi:MAG: hypothetical protein JO018_05320 [Candidatus Eremiobacteraeota bacterium]|nr:hypothetical protein [Candidatus Eremiobacteraeota bacterium]MBV9973479.1 hypothetical protein [Candidatus Eremiobacteraeota bacterium]
MRLSGLCLIAVFALVMAGCAKGNNNADQNTNATATEAPAAAASKAPVTGKGTTASGTMTNLPEYPGATKMASGSSGMGSMGGSASGTVLSTADSFDKVYKWYQSKMPAGSEKTHATTSMGQTAVFTVGELGKDQQSVTINSVAGKTMISLGHVKRP